jgi:flagellar basal-body rod protein FlgG
MIGSLQIAAVGMEAQQLMIDVLANNLANVDTPGFKRVRADFQDLLYRTVRQPGAPAPQGTVVPTGLVVGTGVRVAGTDRLFTQGSVERTGNPLDVAIQGDGFFQVALPDGSVGYTRDGSFRLTGQGQLVTVDGYLVQPGITIPQNATAVTIGADGTVSVQVAGQTAPQQVGQLQLVRFPNPAGLAAIGQNLFVATQASGAPIAGTPGQQGIGTLQQGFLEQSNVSLVEELVALIKAERSYEAMSKVVTVSDAMLGMANTMKAAP